ncbi:MAG: hypothetical protein ACHQO8_08715 [Vicinamibacterales bacterium]
MRATDCLVVLWVAVLTAAPAFAQEAPRRDRDLETLVIDAKKTPPEFSADALIRISQMPKVDDAWRKELLNEAFLRAYGAQEPYRRTSFGIPMDSRQWAQASALDSPMTRIGLQTRATQLMALVDRARAREIFEWIETNVEPGVCDEVLAPALGEYYTTLSLLARTAFAADQRGDALRFLEYYLWRARLPSEMPSVAVALQRFRPRPDEAAYFEGLFRWILESGDRDPRGLSLSGMDLVQKISDLGDADHRLGLTGEFLLGALREYLKSQLRGPRCADSVSEPVTAETFNARVRHQNAALYGVAPLAPDDVRPSRLLAAGRIDLYWQTVDARRLHDAFIDLRGNGKDPVPIRVRQTKDWLESADRFVTDLEHWTGLREPSERDYFCEKAVLFTSLLDVAPPGAVRTKTIRAFVEHLRRADIDRERRATWFLFLNRLLEFSRGSDRRLVLSTMESTEHPVLTLYARLERLAPEARRRSD